ncbi:MAG: hypothetical protein K1Y36_30255 [Blastocatellia bacterium]|nr:hypothetical protein [Blastocatellia bacterium]
MTQRKRRIILILLVLVLGFGWGENSGQTKKSRPPKAAKPDLDFFLTAHSRDSWFGLGEPLVFDCIMTNTGRLPLWVPTCTNGPWRVEIRDEGNRVLKFDTILGLNPFAGAGSCGTPTLEPGQELKATFVIDEFNPIKQPGTYQVRLAKTAGFGSGEQITRLTRSTKVTVQVVSKQP